MGGRRPAAAGPRTDGGRAPGPARAARPASRRDRLARAPGLLGGARARDLLNQVPDRVDRARRRRALARADAGGLPAASRTVQPAQRVRGRAGLPSGAGDRAPHTTDVRCGAAALGLRRPPAAARDRLRRRAHRRRGSHPIRAPPGHRPRRAAAGDPGGLFVSNGWTGGQYSVVRAIFGAYLLVHLLQLIPWGAEVFSRAGILPAAWLSPLTRLFPNV